MDLLLILGYGAAAALFAVLPLLLLGGKVVTQPYRAIVGFSFVFVVSHLMVPLLAWHEARYWHQDGYPAESLLAALLLIVLFGAAVWVGYLATVPILRRGWPATTFDYERWRLLPVRALRIGLVVLGAATLTAFAWFVYTIATRGLGEFMQNRIVILSGLGYVAMTLQWPLVLLCVVLADGVARHRTLGARLPVFTLAVLALFAVFSGLVAGSRTFALLPLVFLLFLGVLMRLRGRITLRTYAFLGLAAIVVLAVGMYLGGVREKVFARGDLAVPSHAPSPSGALVSAFGEYENLVWMVDHPERVELLHGRTFLAAFTGFVPRRVWPDKPLGGGPYMTNMVVPGSYDIAGGRYLTSYTTGLVAESYMNFGTLGLPLMGAAFGALLALVDLLRRRARSPLVFTLWFILFFRTLMLLKAEFFGNMAAVYIALVPLGLLWLLARVFRAAERNPSSLAEGGERG